MRRLCSMVATLCALSFPATAQSPAAQEGLDALRLALEDTGLLLSTGPVDPASMRLPEVRLFNPNTSPIHIDVRFGEVVLEPDQGGWNVRLPESFTASLRWGVGARPWVVNVATQDAVFGLLRGAGGDLNGARFAAAGLEVVSQPGSPGVFVGVANGLSLINTEQESSSFDETWSWDDAGLRASVPQGGGRVLEVDLESAGVERTRRGEQSGWLESLPWMAAIDKGMRIEENWSVGRWSLEASTTMGGKIDRDAIDLRDGTLRFAHARDGVEVAFTGADVALESVRSSLGWGLESPSLSLDARLPTHPSSELQAWSLRTAGTGEALNGAARLPLAWDVDASGTAALARPVFGRTADSWGWFPVLPALDGLSVAATKGDLSVAGQPLSVQGNAALDPAGVSLDATLSGSGEGWPSAISVWGGLPLLSDLLSSPALAEVLPGPAPRRVIWGEGGLRVDGAAP
jgi:hypothetical protein